MPEEWQGSTEYIEFAAYTLMDLKAMKANGSFRTWSPAYQREQAAKLMEIAKLARRLSHEIAKEAMAQETAELVNVSARGKYSVQIPQFPELTVIAMGWRGILTRSLHFGGKYIAFDEEIWDRLIDNLNEL